MRRALAVAVALVAAVAAADVARADHHDINLPWPDQLPALPVTTGVQPHAAPRCHKPTISCVSRVIREMRRRWRPLDRTCNHEAVFALTYLRTTEGLLRTLRRNPRFFQDLRYLLFEDALFADYYFRAYDAYHRHRGFVPDAWRMAFQVNAHGDYNAGHDVLLGMNAHIQRDLPYVLATEGLRRP